MLPHRSPKVSTSEAAASPAIHPMNILNTADYYLAEIESMKGFCCPAGLAELEFQIERAGRDPRCLERIYQQALETFYLDGE